MKTFSKRNTISLIIMMIIALFSSSITAFGQENNNNHNPEQPNLKVLDDGKEQDTTPNRLIKPMASGAPDIAYNMLSLDYGTRTIQYEIIFNTNGVLMENPYLEANTDVDVVSDYTSIVVTDLNTSTVIDSTDFDIQHFLHDTGFRLILKDNYESTASTIRVTFKATYGHQKVKAEDGFLKSFAYIFDDANDKGIYAKQETYLNTHTLNNGFKHGFYHYGREEITWTANINYNRLKAHDDTLYFTDLLELNQVFVPELLIINRFSVSANGEVIVGTQLSPSDFNVALKTTTEGNILEIIINNPEGDGLQIIFTTSIQGDDSHEIYKNKFKFAVGKDGFEYTSLPATVEIDNGRVHIIKTDELGNPMEGVEFGFFSYPHGYGNNDIGVYLVTDADGKVSTQRLKYGRYYLYESMPSPGYNVADNFMEGAIINVTADDTVEMQTYRISNVPTKTWIYKQNENEKYLDWALFKLELLTEDGYMLISDDLELIEGSILITHLDEGTYRLTEIEATQGYLLNTEPLVFELSRNEDNYLEVNNFIFTNYRGSVQLLKMDEDKLKLEGVMFDLYDDKDVLIKSGLLTNLDGKIVVDDLAPGTYYFKETKTLKGLVLNKAPITFTIKASANGKPEAVMLEVVNDKVVLTPDPTDEQTPTVVDIANPTPTDGKVKGAVKVPTAVEQTKGGQTPKTAISDNTNVFMFVIILSAMYITSIQLKKRFKKI